MDQRHTTRWLVKRLQPYSLLLASSFAAAITAGLVSTIDPLLMRHWLDVTLPKRELIASLSMVLLIALCFVGRSAVNGVGSLFSFRVSQLLGQDLRSELLHHMTALSADWHERTLLGEKVSRFEQDVEQIAQFASDALNIILRSVIFFAMNLGIMFALDWRITLIVLPLLPLFAWVRARFRSLIQLWADRTQVEVGHASGYLAEHLGAVPQIQILGAEDVRTSRTLEVRNKMVSAQWTQRKTEIAFNVAVTSVMALAILFLLGMGTHEYLRGALTIGSLVAFYAYVTRLFEPVSTAMELYSRSQRMLASARRVRGVLETQPSVMDSGNMTAVASPLVHGLACTSVSFAYSNGKQVLRDLSFAIRPGERVALIGRSGSGKSSLARLLARMADPASGVVSLEEVPLADYTLRALRQAVCYVPQHPVLFSGTIRENLLYADQNASDSEIEAVIDAAQLLTVLKRQPQGLDTVLGPEAAGLSGGERQRLSIARALLRQSPILVLDESTSALDMPTERDVLRAIDHMRHSQAMVVISHRLRSLTWVDRIVLLNAGRIVAEGTHASLYRESKLYRHLYEKDDEAEGTEAAAAQVSGRIQLGVQSLNAR